MKLRISFNTNLIDGAYGGGNQFVKNLKRHLAAQGHTVLHKLAPDLDAILIATSTWNITTTAYPFAALADYIAHYPNTVVVHRVNTCDEQRANDLGMNRAVFRVNELADYTVFVSAFMRDLYHVQGFDIAKPHDVILTGADENVFNPEGCAMWRLGQKLKIVTHHWSTNYLKGFDIYERLDQLLAIEPYRNWFEFTYVGNLPVGVTFHNACCLPVQSGLELAHTLKQNHLYVTGARYEPGGNHFIEAMQCGLPVLYLESGSSPEYCAPYGIGFTLIDFDQKLLQMREVYPALRGIVLNAPYKATPMCEAYERLFLQLVAERRAHPLPRPDWGTVLYHQRRTWQRNLKQYIINLGRRFLH